MVEYDDRSTQTDTTTTCAEFALSSYTNGSSTYDNSVDTLDLNSELPASQGNIHLQTDCIDSLFEIGNITDQTMQSINTFENREDYCTERIECPDVKTEINIDESYNDVNIRRVDETGKKGKFSMRLRNRKGPFLWEKERCERDKNKTPPRPEQRKKFKCKLKCLDKNETNKNGIKIIIKREQQPHCFAQTEILERKRDEQDTFEGDSLEHKLDRDEQDTFEERESCIPHSEKNHRLDISNVDHITPKSDEGQLSVGKKRISMYKCLSCYKKCAELEFHIERYHYHDYPLQCDQCFHPFRYKMLAKRHKCSLSAVLYKHQCLQCPDKKSFRFRDNLKTHIERCHENNMPLSCDKCHIPLISEYEEEEHIMAKHGPSLISSFCQTQYKNVSAFKKHIEANLKCQLCSELCQCRTILERHVFALHGPYTDKDNRNNDTEGLLTEGDGNKLCEKCGKTIPLNKLAYHMTYFCSKKIYTCKICSMSFKCNFLLVSHLSSHKTATSNSLVCERCGETFAMAKILKFHIKYKHTFQKDYRCSMCDKAFVTKGSLDRHNRVHLKIRNYQCDQCEKSFSTNWNLKAHRRQHTGDTPYKCSKCGDGFAHNVVRKHHEAKCTNYVCNDGNWPEDFKT